MMRLSEPRATPSELQSKILEGLLGGGHKNRKDQPKDPILPADEIVVELIEAVCSGTKGASLRVVSQALLSKKDWISKQQAHGLAVNLGDKIGDEAPCFVVFSTPLLAMFLEVSLGGQPSQDQIERLPSKMECRMALHFAPALANAIKPFTRTWSKHFWVTLMPQEPTAATANDTEIHVIEYLFELNGSAHPINLAIPAVKVERRRTGDAASSKQAEIFNLIEEIGKSHVRCDVRVQLDHQMIESLSKLSVGDILPMDQMSFNQAKMDVRGKSIFIGHLGLSGQRYSFRVAQQYYTSNKLNSQETYLMNSESKSKPIGTGNGQYHD